MNKSSLFYSTAALNVKSLFFNKGVSVYVEGKEDILFWENIFKLAGVNNYHIEAVNGNASLKENMDKIIDEDAQIIVAIDCDHSPFIKDFKYRNAKIIQTYGYSIENTMYCIHNINQTTRRYAKTRKDFTVNISEWYKSFCNDCEILLTYDIANHRFQKGIQVFGDNCTRFLEANDSSKIKSRNVSSFVSLIKTSFSDKEIRQCIRLIKKDKREIQFLIKGHFLTNGVINLIKRIVERETGIRVSISLDSIYTLMVNCIGKCEIKCKDMETITNRVKSGFKMIFN